MPTGFSGMSVDGARRTDGRHTASGVRSGLKPVLIGVVSGTACALRFTRVMSSILYGVSATDSTVFLMACAFPFVSRSRPLMYPGGVVRIGPLVVPGGE